MSRRTGIVGVVVGAVLLVAALVWSMVAVPQLVKFPLSTNVTLHYSGSLVTYVDAKTGAQLKTPLSVPLKVSRTIEALSSESTSSQAVVSERIALGYGTTTVKEDNRYVIDRRSMENVTSDKAYTFAPSNPGASAGSYYVTLPMNLSESTAMHIWKPESGTTYPLVADPHSGQPSSLDGLGVIWFMGTLPMTPVAPYEATALAARGFPSSISPTQVQAQLQAAGVDIARLSLGLLRVLTPSQANQLIAAMTKPVKLNYFAFGSGLVAAQPRTGAIIALHGITDGIAVSPDLSSLKIIATILGQHTSVPGVSAALSALQHLASAPPSPVYELRYTQTPASVSDVVNKTRTQLDQISLVSDWIPLVAAILGALLLIGGAVVMVRRRTPPPAVSGEERGSSETTAA